MSEKISIGVIQSSMSEDRDENIAHLGKLSRKAASKGANIILLPELFETHYFPREENNDFFSLARSATANPTIEYFQNLAKNYNIAMPISFFEKDGENYFNSIAFINELGDTKGVYRKTFIPSGPGYEEKHYFKPGDTGFKVWSTGFGKIGVGICWDQWFPEAARAMAKMDADILLYPSCIGSEPEASDFDTQPLWQKVMVGHAIANTIPIAASNRIGTEGEQTYYGSSFICNHRGKIVTQASRDQEEIIIAEFAFEQNRLDREDFGLLSDLKHSGF